MGELSIRCRKVMDGDWNRPPKGIILVGLEQREIQVPPFFPGGEDH